MTPQEFLKTVVHPNVEDFHSHFADMRRAYNAISAVDALAAHLYFWATVNNPAAVASSNDDTAYRAELAARNQDFALLRDVAKAQKHVRLTRGKPQVSHEAQVTSRQIRYGEGVFGGGRYGGVEQVVIDIDLANFFYAESILDNALAFLEAEMRGLGA
jgi:hypothetical protein